MVTTALDGREPVGGGIGSRTLVYLGLPVLAALAYPWLLATITAFVHAGATVGPPSSAAILSTTLAILLCAAAVMAVGGWIALDLAGNAGAAMSTRARILAHLAFTVPSLLTAVGNLSGVMHARTLIPYIWPALWAAAAVLVLVSPAAPAVFTPVNRRKLVIAHAVSACAILALFVLAHLANHLAGAWSGATHLRVMQAVRHLYRNPLVEPLLFVLIAFQIVSGLLLLQRRLSAPGDVFGTLQSLTGLYVAVYFIGHVTAVISARMAGTDTNWNWLTGHDQGLLFHLSGSALVAHYWVGPIAIVAHLACGLRAVTLEHGVSRAVAGRVAGGLIGVGVLSSTAILAGLLSFHLA